MTSEPYKTLASFESVGAIGSLGIRIEVAGSNLPDLNDKDIRLAGYNALESLKGEITAAIMAASPKQQEKARLEKLRLTDVFYSASLNAIYIEEIPNGYCNGGCCRHLPWFIVTTTVGHFKIGWRKSVISIDWSRVKGAAESDVLFASEDVTKERYLIHAWSYEKAAEYVSKIAASAAARQLPG